MFWTAILGAEYRVRLILDCLKNFPLCSWRLLCRSGVGSVLLPLQKPVLKTVHCLCTPSLQRIFWRSSLRRSWGMIPSSAVSQRRFISRVKCLASGESEWRAGSRRSCGQPMAMGFWWLSFIRDDLIAFLIDSTLRGSIILLVFEFKN